MEIENINMIGESRGNSLASGDPVITNQPITSTDPTSSKNTGESSPQEGEDIVNEQEQHKSVNTEEFIENNAQNRAGDNEKSETKPATTGSESDTDDHNDLPTMTGGAL